MCALKLNPTCQPFLLYFLVITKLNKVISSVPIAFCVLGYIWSCSKTFIHLKITNHSSENNQPFKDIVQVSEYAFQFSSWGFYFMTLSYRKVKQRSVYQIQLGRQLLHDGQGPNGGEID